MRILLIILFTLSLHAQENWPRQLEKLQQSIAIVEYYQPQIESSNINSDTRIKRKITGILVGEDGLVMTSDEIFPANLDITQSSIWRFSQKPPEDITVSFKKGKKYKAELIGKDQEKKLAFIKITGKADLPGVIVFSDRDDFSIGESVFMIEHLDGRFNFERIVTRANINSIMKVPEKRLLSVSPLRPLSGGGLVADAKGRAIGVVVRENLPAPVHDFGMENYESYSTLIKIVPGSEFLELIDKPPVLVHRNAGNGKSWLGVQIQILTRAMAGYWEMGNTSGIIVNSVLPESPAAEAGLQIGDIVTSVGELVIEG